MTPSDSLTWVRFAYHAFDSIWGVVGASLGSFLVGWLLLHKPKFMQKDPPSQ